MSSNIKFACLSIFVVIITVAAVYFESKANKSAIDEYANKNGYMTVSFELRYFTSGPFWFPDEDDSIYKVVFIDSHEHKKIVWFKFGLFTEIKEEE